MAASTVASKDYQKRCSHIYKEFIKQMNCHLKREKEIRDDLNKLRKEKITNMQYSLYRSAGEDVFSSGKHIRQKLMDDMAIASHLMLLDTRTNTPSGLERIPDEDIIRPQTAPVPKLANLGEAHNPRDARKGRPMTVSNSNYRPLDLSDDVTMEMELEHRTGGGEIARPPSTKIQPIGNEYTQPPFSPKLQERVRFVTPNPSRGNKSDDSESDEEVDGEVDPNTERTRARKITITPVAFAQLSIGDILAKLKHKDGKFKIMPINMNYTPNDVDAIFIAKDPTKEKMALVRQHTNCKSSTVSADLKVNNRMAIMKSLMGFKVKKQTVAEIFDHARDRKTRQFRIVLKNPKVPRFIPETVSKLGNQLGNTTPMQISVTRINPRKTNLKTTRNSGLVENVANPNLTATYATNGQDKHGRFPQINVPNETFVRMSSVDSRKGNGIRTDSRMSVSSSVSQDLLQRSLNGRNMSNTGRGTFNGADVQMDSESQTRSVSVMSGRESVIFQGTDADMTEMVRMLVEGEGRNRNDKQMETNRPASRTSVTTSRSGSRFGKRMKNPSRNLYTPLSVRSDSISDMSVGGTHRPKSVNKLSTELMVKTLMREDQEYHEDMESRRRQMASSGGRKFGTIGQGRKA